MASNISLVPKVAQNLALAIMKATDAPVLLLHQDLCVISASTSFCRAYGLDPEAIIGCSVFELGDGEWNVPQLKSLLTATATGWAAIDDYEFELKRDGQPPLTLIAKAQTLNFADADEVRLLLTLIDATAARDGERIKDRFAGEKAILMQELQHRIANSLQLIASVLMQSARKVSSDESKAHLRDAHHRVLSVAALQKQLSISNLGEVELRPYLTQLCASIGASMIASPEKLSLTLTADNIVVPADTSVSLGLIVTELVMNALKHAFPDGRRGHIEVDYSTHGPNWTLVVRDDGVGMSAGAQVPQPGLGSTIVEALAQQLRARIQVSPRSPGTEVRVVHTHLAAVSDPALENRAI